VEITDVCGILDLTVGKFLHDSESWNETDGGYMLLALLA
jgi:hypothetical protein